MSAVDDSAVRLCLRQPLLALNLGVTSAWENRITEPPNPPATWIRETVLPAAEDQQATKLIEAIGLYQIDVLVPVGTGTEVAEALAKQIKEAYPPASSINRTALAVTTSVALDGSEKLRGFNDGKGWYIVPVQIRWRTYATAA